MSEAVAADPPTPAPQEPSAVAPDDGCPREGEAQPSASCLAGERGDEASWEQEALDDDYDSASDDSSLRGSSSCSGCEGDCSAASPCVQKASLGGQRAPVEQAEQQRAGKGRTFEGHYFAVPKTWGPMMIRAPWKLSAVEWAQKLSILNLLLVFAPVPRWAIAVWFILWRLAYNVGIGLVLRWQSNSQGVTRLTSSVIARGPSSSAYRALRNVASTGLDEKEYNFETAPHSFTAWLPFRHFVDVILANDLMAYFAFVFAYWEVPEHFTVNDFVLYGIGLVLNFFSLWAKSDSYRVVKDFAWYWGDFFFLVDEKLTFDRVFRIAPHPMYTIGYSFFYGCTLLSHSYTVLYVSLAAHFSQMLFLAFCETPHMKKIYPELVGDEYKELRNALLYDKTVGYFQKDLLGWKNFNPFRFSDLAVVVIVAQHIIMHLCSGGLHPAFYVAEVVFWRIIHSGVLGALLHVQDRDGFFVRMCARRGMTKRQAFDHWKGIYNLSHTMTIVSFITCAVKLTTDFGGHYYIKQTIGAVLVLISLWCYTSCYEALGDYGWFYGDFFIDDLALPSGLCYSGIYRFMDNPDAIVGYAGFYGAALITESRVMLLLAMFSQLCHFLFVVFVERPHMYKVHGDNLRQNSGISSAVREILAEAIERNAALKELNEKAQLEIDLIKEHLIEEIDQLRGSFGKVKDQAQNTTHSGADKIKQKVRQWKPKRLLEALERYRMHLRVSGGANKKVKTT